MNTLLTGLTESGKTTMGVKLLADFRRAGFPTCVLTSQPGDLDRWRQVADWVTMDANAFMRVVFSPRSRRFMAAVDEGQENVGRWDTHMVKLGTQIRHRGGSALFISQRAVDINRTIRSQCRQVIAFQQDQQDAKLLANEYGYQELLGVSKLAQFEYLWCQRFGGVKRGRIQPG